MHDPMQTEWNVDERMPKYDDIRSFEVFVFGYKRRVRRIGNRSRFFAPGTLIFTDCTHPLQNVLCDEQQISAWRHHQEQA